MNIYFRELKAHRISLIIWCICMVLLVVAGMGKYSATIGAGAADLDGLMTSLPKSLQNLFGVGIFDLSKAVDYFGCLFPYVALLATIHAVMLGASIISKEEQDKTAEFLMTKPVSRGHIITSKLLSALTMVLFFNIVTLSSTMGVMSHYAKGPYAASILKLMVGMFAMQLIFLSIGALFAGLMKNSKRASAAASGLLLVTFMISAMIDMTDKIDFLRFITPFKYYASTEILKGGYSAVYPVLSVIIVVVAIWGSYHFYERRDLNI